MKIEEKKDLKSRISALNKLIKKRGQIDSAKKSLTELLEIIQRYFKEKKISGEYWYLGKTQPLGLKNQRPGMFHLGPGGVCWNSLQCEIGLIETVQNFVDSINSLKGLKSVAHNLREHIRSLR